MVDPIVHLHEEAVLVVDHPQSGAPLGDLAVAAVPGVGDDPAVVGGDVPVGEEVELEFPVDHLPGGAHQVDDVAAAVLTVGQQVCVGLSRIGELVVQFVLSLHEEAILIVDDLQADALVLGSDHAAAAVPGVGEDIAVVGGPYAVLEEVVDDAVHLPGVARDLHGQHVAGVAGVGLIADVVLAPAAAQQA